MNSSLLIFGVRTSKSIILIALLFCILGLPSSLHAEMSDAEKKAAFIKTRETIKPVSKTSSSSKPRPKPRSASSSKSEGSSRRRSKASPTPTQKKSQKSSPKKPESSQPKKSSKSKTENEPPKKTAKESSEPDREEQTTEPPSSKGDDFIVIPGETPAEHKPPVEAPPTATTPSKPAPAPIFQPQIPQGKTPAGRELAAPILIEKSGAQDFEDEDPPAKSFFGGFMKRWRYLSPSLRKAIDHAQVQRGRWKYIVVHNSGTRQGNARIFDLYHRRVRKMQNGLAYHFVIGNGNSSGNGEIEIGNRWTRQINGGHVASDYLNDIALGICLVGDLNRDTPTKDQLGALDELCTYLRGRVGKVKGKSAIVLGHKEINPKPTDCPGDRFPLGWLRKKFSN